MPWLDFLSLISRGPYLLIFFILCRYILVNIFMLLPLEIYSGYNGIKQIYVCICINLYRFFLYLEYKRILHVVYLTLFE